MQTAYGDVAAEASSYSQIINPRGDFTYFVIGDVAQVSPATGTDIYVAQLTFDPTDNVTNIVTVDWERKYGGTANSSSHVSGITFLNDELYLVGDFDATLDFTGLSGLVNIGVRNMFTAKLAASGWLPYLSLFSLFSFIS